MDNEDEYENLEDLVTDQVADIAPEYVDDALNELLPEKVHSILTEILAGCEAVTKDGAVIHSRPMMCLMSPDRSLAVRCFGGLRVREALKAAFDRNMNSQHISEMLETMRGAWHQKETWCLEVQTWANSWESIAEYDTREDAIEALHRVNKAMLAGKDFFQL